MNPTERKVGRREALALGALATWAAVRSPKLLGLNADEAAAAVTRGSSVLAAASQCVLTKELTEGPYYIENTLTRRNITEGQSGLPLIIGFHVVDAENCKAISGADVEIWHANAEGEYSGYDGSTSSGGPSGGGHATPNSSTHYLRGHQVTDASGLAKFITVFPGWYSGRAPHIHVKVHVGGEVVHAGQVFFKTAVEKQVYSKSPYTGRSGQRVYNSGDSIYKQIGSSGIVPLKKRRGHRGYAGSITLSVDE